MGRLLEIFPSRFQPDSGVDAGSFVNQPSDLGNLVYDNRMGNDAGQGYSYRGGGLMQTTGRNNYVELQTGIDTGIFGDAGTGINVVSNPDQINQGDIPMLSALYFYQRHVISRIGTDVGLPSVRNITRLVNGWENGLPERINTFNRAIRVLFNSDAGH